MSIIVFCPSRGRPDQAREAAQSLVATRVLGDTQMIVVVDDDDPLRDEYIKEELLYQWLVVNPEEKGMVAALNHAVGGRLQFDREMDVLGFIGDDHRFRTPGWDLKINQALVRRPGFAYGYDTFWQQGEIPTQIFITREVVEALGYFALPDCTHLYVDNAWKALGEETHSLTYVNDITVEHLHPAKTLPYDQWDEGHQRVNTPEMYGRDGAAFQAWRESQRFAEDVQRVRAALPRPQPVRYW